MTNSQRKDHLDSLAIGLLLACCSLWGVQQVLAKATMTEIAPVFQASLRFVGAAVLILLWCAWRGIALFERDGSLAVGLFAGTLFACEFAAIYLGLSMTGASRLTVFLYTAPFWVAIVLPMFVSTEALSRLQWLGLACAFIGVIFALWGGLRTAIGGVMGNVWGDVLGLASGMFWGLTTVVIRATKLVQLKPEKTLFYQVIVTAFLLPWLSLALGERWNFQLSAFAWGSMAVQTVLGAFASYLVWMWMLTRYPAAKMSAFAFLAPVIALFVSNFWLNEPITLTLVLALLGVTVGIVLVNWRR